MPKIENPQDALRNPEKLQHRIRTLEQDLEKALAENDALACSVRRHQSILDHLPFGLITLDDEGGVFSANRTFAEITGQDQGALTGDEGLAWEGCLNSKPLEKAVDELLESGLEFDVDLPPSAAAAGIDHYLSFHGHVLRDSNGEDRGHLILVEDMAGRDEAGARLKSSLNYLRRIILGAVEAMSVMVERRDPFVAGHMRRTAELAAAIAGEMDLDGFEVEGIRIAALLHDIGKVAVPSEILCKPAPLSAAEEKIVRTHPIVAQRILKRVPFPWPIADAILQHSERLDGSGYPKGLKGDDIILQARILAVSDTVEAMLTYRPYRPAHPLPVVMAQISENKGRLYDPQVVEACVRLFRDKHFEFTQS